MRSKSGTVRMIDAWHRLHKLREYSAIDLGTDDAPDVSIWGPEDSTR